MLTPEQFKELYPRCKDPERWIFAMNTLFPKYDIITNKRIAAFISQCGHESAGWKTFEENLNYSAKALNSIFPKYFKKAGRDANEYHRKPEKIANVIYANRMGNGDTESGDGWKYRGRGPIQLTGSNNYRYFSGFISKPSIHDNPDIVKEDKAISLLSALWYWNSNNLNKYADSNDIKGLTRRINGGLIGLDDRIKHYNDTLEMLYMESQNIDSHDENEEPLEYFDFGVLKRGSKGEGVIFIQEFLGLNPDGWFGKNTEAAVIKWQKENNLYPDGIIGPKTIDKMLGL